MNFERENSSSGFGLIEVMVAFALMGVVGVGVMRLTETMSKSNTKARADSDYLLATNEIISILSDPVNCKKTIPNINAKISKVHFGALEKFKIGDPFGDTGTVISNYKLLYPGKTDKDGTLLVYYKKKEILGGGETHRKIGLYLEVKSDKSIEHCRSVVFSPDIWTRGAGQWASDIFFHGRVGIGTSEPRDQLEVNSSITALSQSGTFALMNTNVIDNTGLSQDQGGHPVFFGKRGRGTLSALQHSKKNDVFASFVGRDYLAHQNAIGGPLYGGAAIYMMAAEDQGPSSLGSIISFETTRRGEKQAKTNMVIHDNGSVTIGADAGDPNFKVSGFDPSESQVLRVHSKNGQGGIILSGAGDLLSGERRTHSQLSLAALDTTNYTDNWYFAHKNESKAVDGAQAGALEIGRGTGTTHYMTFLRGGNVGISDRNPVEKLTVDGKIKATGDIMSGGSVISSSDKRLKKEVTPLKNSLDKVLKLQGVGYMWKESSKNTTDKQLGLIAQDVREVFPEVTSLDKDGFWGIAYANLIAPIIEAIKELNSEIRSLKSENQELRNYICTTDPSAPFCNKGFRKL